MFELNVVSNTPLTPLDDVDDVALQFLTQIGYLPTGYDPKTEVTNVKDSVPYKLFMKCFMRNMKRVWLVEELAATLKTTKPTIYRHLNKLKGYRIRYGDLKKAWSFTEANVEMAMDGYRKTVDHLQKLVEEER
jgi:hypothetical protein